MAEETLLQKIQKEFTNGKYRARSRQAHDWYINRLKNISNLNRSRILNDPMFIVRRAPVIGAVHAFFYEAKHAETLPYWDRFPLTIVVQPEEGGFSGLNLHYAPPQLRALLLSRLYTVSSNRRFDESTKMNLSYQILKDSQKFKAFRPLWKRYLTEQVRSPFTIVPASEWALMAFVPSEMFLGSTKERVWKDTQNAI